MSGSSVGQLRDDGIFTLAIVHTNSRLRAQPTH